MEEQANQQLVDDLAHPRVEPEPEPEPVDVLDTQAWCVVANHGRNPIGTQLVTKLKSCGKSVVEVNPYGGQIKTLMALELKTRRCVGETDMSCHFATGCYCHNFVPQSQSKSARCVIADVWKP